MSYCVSWELLCINWNEPLYRQPLNTSWVRAGGCKQSLSRYPPSWSRSAVATWMSAGKFFLHITSWLDLCCHDHTFVGNFPAHSMQSPKIAHKCYPREKCFWHLLCSLWFSFVISFGTSLRPTVQLYTMGTRYDSYFQCQAYDPLCFRGQAWWHAIHLELY